MFLLSWWDIATNAWSNVNKMWDASRHSHYFFGKHIHRKTRYLRYSFKCLLFFFLWIYFAYANKSMLMENVVSNWQASPFMNKSKLSRVNSAILCWFYNFIQSRPQLRCFRIVIGTAEHLSTFYLVWYWRYCTEESSGVWNFLNYKNPHMQIRWIWKVESR